MNWEVLEGEDFPEIDGKEGLEEDEEINNKSLFAKMVNQNPQSSNSGNILALAFPLVMAMSLGISYFAVILSGTPDSKEHPVTMLPDIVMASLPYSASLLSTALCLLFMATVLHWVLSNDTR